MKTTDILNTRKPFDTDDWGDNQTIGLHLKRRKSFEELKEDDFAIFLGIRSGKIVLGIKNWNCEITSYKVYSTIDEAKQEWEID